MACWRSRSTAIYPSHMRQVGESGVGNAENGRATHPPAGQPSASVSPTSGNLPLRSALPPRTHRTRPLRRPGARYHPCW